VLFEFLSHAGIAIVILAFVILVGWLWTWQRQAMSDMRRLLGAAANEESDRKRCCAVCGEEVASYMIRCPRCGTAL
jgi:uncharacterized paraquat-inducible protein A